MTPHLAPSFLGMPVAVLVRPPLRLTSRTSVRWRLHHAAASAVVPTAAGPLTVVSTHLNPFFPARRRREARRLARRYAGELAIVAGDLNSLDPHGDHADELARLRPRYRKRHAGRDGEPDTRAVATFEAAGFRDLWAVAGEGDGRTVPTSAGGGHEFSGMRLDYVLGGAAVAARVTGARVVRGGAAEYASDHYPLALELDLTARD
jgi:exodeoxyribonuclease III